MLRRVPEASRSRSLYPRAYMQWSISSFAFISGDGIITPMRLQPIIVPGWQGSGPGHWQTHWSRTLPHAVRLQQRDWHQPQRAEWVAALAAAVDAAPTPVLLVAHSLGCLVSAALPIALRAKVAGALLVAPADVERPGAPAAIAAFGPVPRQSLPYQSVVIASDDDPYCRLERARQFAQDWGSRLVVLQGAGHINADSQLGAWPQGLKQLAALRRRACWRISPPAEKIPPVPAGLMAPPRYG